MATLQATQLPANPPRRRLLHPRLLRRTVLYGVCLILSVLFVFPLFWALMSSLKAPFELFIFPPKFFPSPPQWGNYRTIFETFPFPRWYWNTFLVVLLNTSGVLVTSSLVAYGFARFEFRFRGALFMLVIAMMMLPAQITLIPRFILFNKLHWLNTLLPLWVPAWFGGSSFAIFLMRQFFLTLPRDLDEAAVLDGASYFRVFWQILMPLCTPALATVAIINSIAVWSDFLDPVVFLNSTKHFTIAVGLWFFKEEPMSSTPTTQYLLAASVTSIIPPILIFFAFQRFFVRGVALTGLKG